MNVQPLIEHIKASCPHFKAVGGAVDLDAAINAPRSAPSAFVVPSSESATRIGSTQVVKQHKTHVFMVVMVVANRRDGLGVAALADLANSRQRLEACLVGHVPEPSNGEPVVFQDGRLLRMDGDGYLWWVDRFSFDSYLRK